MKTYNEIRRGVEREINKEYRNKTIAVVVLVLVVSIALLLYHSFNKEASLQSSKLAIFISSLLYILNWGY